MSDKFEDASEEVVEGEIVQRCGDATRFTPEEGEPFTVYCIKDLDHKANHHGMGTDGEIYNWFDVIVLQPHDPNNLEAGVIAVCSCERFLEGPSRMGLDLARKVMEHAKEWQHLPRPH